MRDFLGAVLSVTWVCQRFLAGLCRIGLTALLWHPRSPVPCPVHRLRVLTPQTAEAAAACQNRMQVLSLRDVALYIFPHCLFSSKAHMSWRWLRWVWPFPLRAAYTGKCPKSGQESLPEHLRGGRLLAQSCGVANQAACGELVWGRSCSAKSSFICSSAVMGNWTSLHVYLNFLQNPLQCEETPNFAYRELFTKGRPFFSVWSTLVPTSLAEWLMNRGRFAVEKPLLIRSSIGHWQK